MAEKREISLTEENWETIDTIMARIPDSDFLRFWLMNDIVEEGIRLCLKKYFKTET